MKVCFIMELVMLILCCIMNLVTLIYVINLYKILYIPTQMVKKLLRTNVDGLIFAMRGSRFYKCITYKYKL